MQKNNDIRILCDRLRMIRSELSMTQEDMARIIGIGKSALSMIETGRASLSERNRNILIQTLNVNPEWLESGTGAMFNEQFPERTFLKGSDRPVGSQSVPLYNVEGTAGLVPLFLDKASRQPVDYIHIPNLPKCDGAIYVVGDSMYPLLKSGDFWGDMYLLSIDIDGEEYITVKYIQKSDKEGCVRLVSQNVHHAD